MPAEPDNTLPSPADETPSADTPSLRGASSGLGTGGVLMLVGVLALAAVLRLVGLDQAPPGLHQDEASNAWNAYCLLKTGTDEFGTPWPIFCMRAIGDYRSTLYTYTMIPFQAVGGLNVWTTRLPAAVGGILTVLLIYWVAARLFNPGTGLAAAALLAANPTHIQLSRLGLEASQTPLLTLLPLAALLWAGLPLADSDAKPRPLRAVIAGLLTGACCYGYPAVRLFLPVFLTGCVLLTWRAWWRVARSRRGVATLVGLLLGLGATFGPLAYKHIAEPETIAKRGQTTWVWSSGDPASVRVGKVVERYAHHFHPDYLFETGDADETFWAVPFGLLTWYLLPFVIVGLAIVVWKLRGSRAMRVVLVGVVFYPIADALNWHVSLHTLRSSAGLCALIMLAGIGLSWPLAVLRRQHLHAWLLTVSLAMIALIVPQTVRFLRVYFHDRPHQTPVYYGTHMDLLAACEWLRPELADVDVVICFAAGQNPGYTPYLITLLSLQHEPRAWFAEPREVYSTGVWDRCVSYGKFHFLYGEERERLMDRLRAAGEKARVVLFLRPEDARRGEPTATINGPDDKPTVLIYDLRL